MTQGKLRNTPLGHLVDAQVCFAVSPFILMLQYEGRATSHQLDAPMVTVWKESQQLCWFYRPFYYR